METYIKSLLLFLLLHGLFADDETKLANLQHTFFEYIISENPEFASHIGDNRWDDKVDDYSLEKYDRWKIKVEETMKQLKEISREKLRKKQKIDYDIFESYLQTYLDGYKWRMYNGLRPVSLMGKPKSLQKSNIIFTTEKEVKNHILRIQKFPNQLMQIKRLMQKAIELNRTLHRISIDRVPAMLDPMLAESDDVEGLYNYKLFKESLYNLTSITEDKKQALLDEFTPIQQNYINSLRDFKSFLENVYLKNTRKDLGISSLDNGKEFYKALIKYRTSLALTPEEIHQTGIEEVERISSEMKKIFQRFGISGSIKESFAELNKDKKYFLKTSEEMVDMYQDIIYNKIESKMSLMFGTRPSIPVLVEASEQDGVFGFYENPKADGTRPGVFKFNAYHPDESPTYSFMALALHESNPGHHQQIATAKTSNLPKIRGERLTSLYYQVPSTFPTWTAFLEGWGLYAEYLGEEMGLYETDAEMLGRYSFEILRACRLVVDTGLHYYNWTKPRAVEYLTNYTSLGDSAISFEVDRYVTIPAQAIAYKIGEIKFKELRAKAEKSLGDKFDVRDFHDTVLSNGPMSFTNLERVVDKWIESVQQEHTNSANTNTYSIQLIALKSILLLFFQMKICHVL